MYSLVVGLLRPFFLACLFLVVATVMLWRKRRSRRRLRWLTAAVVVLLLICTPAVSFLALGTLEWRAPPPRLALPDRADVIVVLSGAVRVYDEQGKIVEPCSDTMFRCLHAAKVYRRVGPCPVLAAGGKLDPDEPGPTLARAMRDLLVQLGVDPADIILEEESTSTYENALFSQRLLAERGLKRIVLVTDALHMHRASLCFRHLGLEVTPAPCNYRVTEFEWVLRSFLPNPGAAVGIQEALHEWLGIVWYRLKGRI